MTIYVVTYDLKKPGQNYKDLYDALDEMGAHRALESFWLVNVANTAKELHDYLKERVDGNDRIWVSELTKKRHYSNAKAGTNDWLKGNPPGR